MRRLSQNKLYTDSLKRLYRIPPPESKEEFFQSGRWQTAAENTLYTPRISWFSFLTVQIRYIRKWNWLLSAFLFGGSLILSFFSGQTDAGWGHGQFSEMALPAILSACLPFLALAAVTEAGYSARFCMEELELSTRFSLHAVLCARLGILGAANLLLLAFLIPVSSCLWETDLSLSAACILLPYLLTCALTLPALRKYHGREGTVLCAGITALTSALFLILNITGLLRESADRPAFIPISLLLIGAAAALELKKYLKQSEELTWNFTLTA